MIYISSSCIKTNSISTAIKTLANEGFTNIELSGGTAFNPNALSELVELKNEFQLNILLHNYFPTPQQPFVLNLAALDQETNELSKKLIKKAIDWSEALGANKYAFHAGFLLNIPLSEVGKKISKTKLFDEEASYQKFEESLMEISEYNENRVELYVENNVLSNMNYRSFEGRDPFFFTSSENLSKINIPSNINILLDVAHLKVSCNTLSLNFETELKKLYQRTDYVHFSDNNGMADTNQVLSQESDLFQSLNSIWTPGNTLTIEVYSGMEDIKTTYNALEKLNNYENEKVGK